MSEELLGDVVRLNDRGFCFVMTPLQREAVFCHRSAFPDYDFDRVRRGSHVAIVLGVDRSGRPCATRARIAEDHRDVPLPAPPRGYVPSGNAKQAG